MKKDISPFSLAATYIGTVVGAGFASGLEVLQFFGYLGVKGIWGLLLTTALFTLFGYFVLELGFQLRANCHLPVIRHAGGPLIGRIIDVVITFFLFGALTIMMAGGGAILHEQFGLPKLLGNSLMAIISILTVVVGIGGVISANSLVVPLLFFAVIGVSGYSLFMRPGAIAQNLMELDASQAVLSWWPASAVAYTSYNIILAVAVLAPLGALSSSRRTLKLGALMGGFGLGLAAIAITLALWAKLPEAAKYEIPMVYVAGGFSCGIRWAYSLVLLTEVYTTAVGNLYGFCARMIDPERGRGFPLLVVITGVAAFLAAQLGFTTMVRVLYPAMGYAGLILLGALTYRKVKDLFKLR
ncbi:MAG: hypothetical protein ACOY9Y_11780 [Bacillota bacterium]